MFIIDVTHPVVFTLCCLLLCVFMFACGVFGTLIGITLAKGVLRAIDREASSFGSYHERQSPIEHRQSRQMIQSGETHDCFTPDYRTSGGNLPKFRRIRIRGTG